MPVCHTPHLHRRGSIYWFRRAVPRSLVARFGLIEIKGSLKTRDALIARQRCRLLSNKFDILLARVEIMADLTHDTIKEMVREYFQESINQSAELVAFLHEDKEIDPQSEAEAADELVAMHKQLHASGASDHVTSAEARRILVRHGVNPETVSLALRNELYRLVMRARIEDWRITGAKLRMDYAATNPVDPLFNGMDVNGFPPLPGEVRAEGAPITLGETASRYCEMKSSSAWGRKTLLDNRRVLELAKRVLGAETAITQIDKTAVRRLRDVILKLPASYMKRKDQADLPLDKLLEDTDQKRLSAKTQSKYFEMFRSFVRWCVAEDYLETIPGETIKIAGPSKAEVQEARYPFSTNQLKNLFASPLYAGCKSEARRSVPGDQIIRDGKWWIPLIALYSGLRMGEIVQLLVSDIKEQDGVTYFDIARGEGEDKQLKTASSVRRVPIHPVLLEHGFLDHVEVARGKNPKGRVFTDITPGADGYFSHNFSKWFSRYLTSTGIKTPKTTFHSFRHNFKDALVLAEVPDNVRMALMGHSDSSVHGLYGSKLPIQFLDSAVRKVSYDLEI